MLKRFPSSDTYHCFFWRVDGWMINIGWCLCFFFNFLETKLLFISNQLNQHKHQSSCPQTIRVLSYRKPRPLWRPEFFWQTPPFKTWNATIGHGCLVSVLGVEPPNGERITVTTRIFLKFFSRESQAKPSFLPLIIMGMGGVKIPKYVWFNIYLEFQTDKQF